MQPVRWGILSTAKIGRTKVVPGLMKSPLCNVVAVASRDEGTARAMAAELGIPKAYGSYEALLADPEIEAIYNPLPNHLHVPLTLTGRGSRQACAVREADRAHRRRGASSCARPRRKVLIVEAFMVRFHPQWLRARELVREGRDRRRCARCRCSSPISTSIPTNIRNKADIGGGGALRHRLLRHRRRAVFLRGRARRAVALIDRDPALRHRPPDQRPPGFRRRPPADFTVSTQSVPYQRVQILGTKGRIEIQIPFNAPPDVPTPDLRRRRNRARQPLRPRHRVSGGRSVSAARRGFQPRGQGGPNLAYGLEDAIMNMRILDALRRSETSAAWERV